MLTMLAALLIAPNATDQTFAAATVPIAASAAPTPAATPAGDPEDEVCRKRMIVGQGLIGGVKQKKVCKTRAEWREAGSPVD